MSTIETPEGVSLSLRPAGAPVRAAAFAVDLAARAVLYGFVASSLGLLGEAGTGLMFVVVFATEWFAPVLFEVLWQGRTPGKALLSLRVVHEDGTPVGWSASILRNLLRAADFLPVMYGFGIASMLADSRFRRLGDLAAGTVVIHDDRRLAPRAAPGGGPEPIPVSLKVDEQRAILEFARRHPGWSEDRAAELAEVLEPMHGAQGSRATVRLLAMASWLRGDS